jgi:hypothetical protein
VDIVHGLAFGLYMHPEKILSEKPLSKYGRNKERARRPTEYADPVPSDVFIISASPPKKKEKRALTILHQEFIPA